MENSYIRSREVRPRRKKEKKNPNSYNIIKLYTRRIAYTCTAVTYTIFECDVCDL